LQSARIAGHSAINCSLDLRRSTDHIGIEADCWIWNARRFPYPGRCKDHTIYFWCNDAFEPVARFSSSLIKLIPTTWGPPTFEIDGIKMLPSAVVSPYADAEQKVNLIQPRGKVVFDTCGGLGYFAAWCLQGHASQILSFEKNSDVLWLRSLNPWSPGIDSRLTLTHGDVTNAVMSIPTASVGAVLHDPPRFGIAGELYSQDFYDQLARVLKKRGRLFHYTGTPNKRSSGRDVPQEVMERLIKSGFAVARAGDGVLAIRT